MPRTSRRPSPPFVLNPGSPQACGLVAWYPLFGQRNVTNYAWGRRGLSASASTVSGVGWNGALQSPGTAFNGSSDVVYVRGGIDDENAITGHPATLVCWHIGSSTGTQALYGTATGADASNNYFGYWMVENSINFGDGTGTSATDRQSFTATAGATTGVLTCTVGVVRGAGDFSFYRNGVLQDGTTSGTGGAIVFGSNLGAIGARLTGTDIYYAGVIYEARLYNRALNDSEAMALYHPTTRWDLYWQPSQRLYFDVVAAAAGVPKQMDNILRSTWA